MNRIGKMSGRHVFTPACPDPSVFRASGSRHECRGSGQI